MSENSIKEKRLRDYKEGKETWLIGPLLFKLYGLTKMATVRSFIRDIVLKLEGGGYYSRTIRRIFSVYHKIDIGMYTKEPCEYLMQLPAGTKIGRYCAIYPTVHAFNGNHPSNRRSTHAFFYNPGLGYAKAEHDIMRHSLTIGNDTCIYHNVTILPSVSRIGDGVIIAAGAIVTKNVPDFAVVLGQPAKILRYRFSEKTRLQIKASKWWDKDINELVKDFEEFTCPIEDDNDKRYQSN